MVIDLFCGFGGTTTGFHQTDGKARVIACVNHDPKAIKSHWMNYPEVKHFEEDIRTLDLGPLVKHLARYKKKYPHAKVILWASLECTNFSKAKGGLPRDADSRTLADHLHRYITALDPDYVKIENVVEFMSWGPLDEKGKPLSRRNGEDWLRWCKEICALGYYDQWQEMNSADYGAYTSRNRLFGCFAKRGLLIAWPKPTHAKKVHTTDLFSNTLKPWMPVRDVLHLDTEGASIFTRKKDLSEKTLERIYAGLIKFVAGGDKSFIAKYYSGRPAGKVIGLDGPAGVISTFGNQGLVTANFITKYYSGKPSDMVSSIEDPAATIRTKDGQSLISANFILKYNSTNKNGEVSSGHSIDDVCPVVSTQGRLALVKSEFLVNYQHSSVVNSIDEACPTITTKDKYSLVHPQFLCMNYSNGPQHATMDKPCPTVSTKDRFSLLTTKQFIHREYKSATNSSIEEPAGTLPTVPKINLVSTKHYYIVNPSYYGHSHDIDGPCPVIVARQDKAPLYLVNVTNGNIEGVEISESDSECMIKIKVFMLEYGIVDIKMRMLMVPELLKIQGFPEDYKMSGNQTDAKKFIGNSVVPHVVKAWALKMSEVI